MGELPPGMDLTLGGYVDAHDEASETRFEIRVSKRDRLFSWEVWRCCCNSSCVLKSNWNYHARGSARAAGRRFIREIEAGAKIELVP